MLGYERAVKTAKSALSEMDGSQNQVLVEVNNSALTRIANSEIHQNVSWRDTNVSFRTDFGGAPGWSKCNRISSEDFERCALFAQRMAEYGKDGDSPSMAGPAEYPDADNFCNRTAQFGPDERAEAVAVVTRRAEEEGFAVAGALQVSITEHALVNSKSLTAFDMSTSVEFICVVFSDEGSGYASKAATSVDDMDFSQMAEEAVQKCKLNTESQTISPGRYTVFLDEYAVGDMIKTLSAMGFGAHQVQRGQSFMSGRIGEKMMDERINIWDDALNSEGLPAKFDVEGVPKKKVSIIDDGAPAGPVYDLKTARDAGCESTGHASGRGPGSPAANNLLVATDEASKEDMISDIKRGIYITRFHYIAPVNAAQTRWSGMTRDGTFLIEDGKITDPLLNLRFDDRIIDSLSKVRDISSQGITIKGRGAAVTAPAMSIDDFNITGTTQ